MFATAAWRTLQLLFFRGGPQDFPYSDVLARTVPVLAIGANILLLGIVLPPLVAAAMGVTMVVVLALFTRGLLRARGMLNRFQQTFNSLLATDLVLKLLMLPAFYQLAPKLLELAQNPELLSDPAKYVLPQGPMLATNLFSYWSFAVSANIYRQAAEVNIFIGVILTFLALIFLLFATAVASGLLRALLG
jgi:hypothetical protein